MHFEKLLELPGGDTSNIRILLSICEQNNFQPDLVEEHHLKAAYMDPKNLAVFENKAKLLIDEGKFELAWDEYCEGAKRRKYPDVFKRGKHTVII